MPSKCLIDRREIVRFLASGILSTVANLSTVWVCLYIMRFEFALIAGLVAGIVSSFLLMKLFAFRARNWKRAHSEVGRFLLVYLVGVVLYYGVAYVFGDLVFPALLQTRIANMIGATMGAGTMTFSSYFGHKFYTYSNGRSQRDGQSQGD